MNRKGNLPMSTMGYLIIGVAITLVMVWVVGQFFEEGKSTVSRENCQRSVQRNENFHDFYIPLPPSSINCPTEFTTVNSDDNDENNKLVADSLYKCRNDFKNAFTEGGVLFNKDGVYCNVCEVLDVKKEVKGYQKFIFEEPVPDPTQDKTYYEYVNGFMSKDAESVIGDLKLPTLVPVDPTAYDSAKLLTPEDVMKYCADNPANCGFIQNVYGDISSNSLEPGQYAAIFAYARGQDHVKRVYRHLLAMSWEGQDGLAFGMLGAAQVQVEAAGVKAAIRTGRFLVMPIAKRSGIVLFTSTVARVTGVALGGTNIVGIVVTVGTFVATEAVAYHFSKDTPPQWGAFVLLREWSAENPKDSILRDELECEVIV